MAISPRCGVNQWSLRWNHSGFPSVALTGFLINLTGDSEEVEVMPERAIRLSTDDPWKRRAFIGGSDARIMMGSDEARLVSNIPSSELVGPMVKGKTRAIPKPRVGLVRKDRD
jgi:hypothetical protein